MKIRNILFTPILFIVMISGLFSCGVDRWPEYAEETELDIWIDSVMRQEYLWYNEMRQFSCSGRYGSLHCEGGGPQGACAPCDGGKGKSDDPVSDRRIL